MDEQTTTEPAAVDPGASVAQPEPVDAGTAAETPQEPQTETLSETTEEPQDDNSEWLKSKGIDPNTPEGQAKLAKSYRELERSFHDKSKKAAELERSMVSGFDDAVETEVAQGEISGDDPRIAIKRLEIKQNVRDFFDENPGAKAYEAEMVKIVQSKPHLSGDLDALYALAKVSDPSREETLKSDGGRQALENLASKQRAAAPTGAAVQPMTSAPKITRAILAERTNAKDFDWLNKHQAEINQMVADGTLK